MTRNRQADQHTRSFTITFCRQRGWFQSQQRCLSPAVCPSDELGPSRCPPVARLPRSMCPSLGIPLVSLLPFSYWISSSSSTCHYFELPFRLAVSCRFTYLVLPSKATFVLTAQGATSMILSISKFPDLHILLLLFHLQKYLHALSPTPASQLSPSDLAAAPPNTTPSPYEPQPSTSQPAQNPNPPVPGSVLSTGEPDGQYWRWQEQPNKRQRTDGGDKVCFDFQKGRCERGDRCR